MKYLIAIPVLYGAEHCKQAILSAYATGANVLVADNGADQDVKDMLKSLDVPFWMFTEQKNIYVNPIWNVMMKYFLAAKTHDVLCIMNSDVVIPPNTLDILNKFYANYPNHIPLPVEGQPNPLNTDGSLTVQEVSGGVAGTFICLTRQQVQNIFPIPDSIKLWFGDNWLYDTHRQIGVKTLLVHDLKIHHGNSRTISILSNVSELIEQDKVAWANEVEPAMHKLVERLKSEKV